MPKLYLNKSVILEGKFYPPESEITVVKKVADQIIDDGAAVPMSEVKAEAEAKEKAKAEAEAKEKAKAEAEAGE